MRFREAGLAARPDASSAQAPNAQPKRPKACILMRKMC